MSVMSSSQGEDRSCLDGFEREIFRLVLKNATSEQWRDWLRAPLEHAAADGNVELFTRLMGAGADGSAGWRGCHGRTLLGAASYGKSLSIVLTLLRMGVEDDLDFKFGARRESALHVAVRVGAQKVSNALMLAGADPNLLNGDKESPLHLAAEKGCPAMVNELLLRGALPNTKTPHKKQTALHLAAAAGYTRCVSLLVQGGAVVDSRGRTGETPLHLAVEHNHPGAVEELLAAGAQVDSGYRFSDLSALMMASSLGHVGVVVALLQHGSDARAIDKLGLTALHHAADAGSDFDNGDIIRLLLEAGADVNAKVLDVPMGWGPLHAAVTVVDRVPCSNTIHPSRGTILALLEGGADVDMGDYDGRTPLHDACCLSNVGAVEILLRWGADEARVDQLGGKRAEEVLGSWRYDEDEDEERKADDQRIRHMLARSPADRAWRRRGWLVLARSRPGQVQVAPNGLVGRVVGLEEDFFRVVMSFV